MDFAWHFMRVHVHPFAWNISSSTGQIFMKFDIFAFFESLSRVLKLHENLKRITGSPTLLEKCVHLW
jgi:hypothetical protein